MCKIAYALSQNPNSSYTEPREEYLVLRSKRGILCEIVRVRLSRAERNPEPQTSERRPSRLREEMAFARLEPFGNARHSAIECPFWGKAVVSRDSCLVRMKEWRMGFFDWEKP
jgi:hypothetical protein